MDFSSLQETGRRPIRVPTFNYSIGINTQPLAPIHENVQNSKTDMSTLINDGSLSPSYSSSVYRAPLSHRERSLTSKAWVQSAFGDILRNGGKTGCSVCGGKK
jgi:hypothetical protein